MRPDGTRGVKCHGPPITKHIVYAQQISPAKLVLDSEHIKSRLSVFGDHVLNWKRPGNYAFLSFNICVFLLGYVAEILKIEMKQKLNEHTTVKYHQGVHYGCHYSSLSGLLIHCWIFASLNVKETVSSENCDAAGIAGLSQLRLIVDSIL